MRYLVRFYFHSVDVVGFCSCAPIYFAKEEGLIFVHDGRTDGRTDRNYFEKTGVALLRTTSLSKLKLSDEAWIIMSCHHPTTTTTICGHRIVMVVAVTASAEGIIIIINHPHM